MELEIFKYQVYLGEKPYDNDSLVPFGFEQEGTMLEAWVACDVLSSLLHKHVEAKNTDGYGIIASVSYEGGEA